MFVISEPDVSTIRAAFDRGGEFSAAVELRRLFPGTTGHQGCRGTREAANNLADILSVPRDAATIMGWPRHAIAARASATAAEANHSHHQR